MGTRKKRFIYRTLLNRIKGLVYLLGFNLKALRRLPKIFLLFKKNKCRTFYLLQKLFWWRRGMVQLNPGFQ